MTRKLTALTFTGSLLFFVMAILFYRGGNYSNDTVYFQWITNYISDLGLVYISAASQPYVRWFFGLTMFLMGLSIVGTIINYSETVSSKSKRFYLSLSVTVAALATAIPLLPADVYQLAHRNTFVLLLITAALLWLMLSRQLAKVKRYQKLAVIFTDVTLWGYLGFVLIVPRPETSLYYSMFHAQVEKSVFLVFLFCLGILIFDFPNRKFRYTK